MILRKTKEQEERVTS